MFSPFNMAISSRRIGMHAEARQAKQSGARMAGPQMAVDERNRGRKHELKRRLHRGALAIGLMVAGVASQAQPVSPKLPTRPAPVSGKIGADPAAVALRPAGATPAVATSTARQVAPPANPNEPLFKEEAVAAHMVSTSAATGTAPAAVQASNGSPKVAAPAHASSAVQGKPHVEHTAGKKLNEATTGRKKTSKAAGHEHADKAAVTGRKKKGAKSKDEASAAKVAHVKHSAQAKQPESRPSHKKATHLAQHGKGAATAAATSAQTVSTAHELKPASARKHAAVQKKAGKLAKARKAHAHPMDEAVAKQTAKPSAKHTARQAGAKHKAARKLAAKPADTASAKAGVKADKANKKAARKAVHTTAAV
jgi:hypothetical protein